MTVYEANRKNVFRARARARPGQRQQNFCGDLSLFVVIYKPWSRSEDTFYRDLQKNQLCPAHTHCSYFYILIRCSICSIKKHFKGYNCDFVATQGARGTVTLPCIMYIKVELNSFQQHFPHYWVFLETIQSSLEH